MVNNAKTKKFYEQVFEWEFAGWGPNYISFSGANIDGGFNRDTQVSNPGVLVVLYANDLNLKLGSVTKSGGEI